MLKVKENNSATIKASVRQGDNTIENINDWSFQFQVQTTGGVVIINKTSASAMEILISDAANGKIEIYIQPADTATRSGQFRYELKGTDITGNEYTLDGPYDFIITPTIIA